MVAKAENMRVRRLNKMRHPNNTLRTLNASIAAMTSAQRNYDLVFHEEKDQEELDKIYHKVNQQPTANQLGIVKQSMENFKKSQSRFQTGSIAGSHLVGA